MDEEFELLDRHYFVSYFQDYFKYIIKKQETLKDKSPVQIYLNKIQKRIIFEINIGYYLELLTPETMKQLEGL